MSTTMQNVDPETVIWVADKLTELVDWIGTHVAQASGVVKNEVAGATLIPISVYVKHGKILHHAGAVGGFKEDPFLAMNRDGGSWGPSFCVVYRVSIDPSAPTELKAYFKEWPNLSVFFEVPLGLTAQNKCNFRSTTSADAKKEYEWLENKKHNPSHYKTQVLINTSSIRVSALSSIAKGWRDVQCAFNLHMEKFSVGKSPADIDSLGDNFFDEDNDAGVYLRWLADKTFESYKKWMSHGGRICVLDAENLTTKSSVDAGRAITIDPELYHARGGKGPAQAWSWKDPPTEIIDPGERTAASLDAGTAGPANSMSIMLRLLVGGGSVLILVVSNQNGVGGRNFVSVGFRKGVGGHSLTTWNELYDDPTAGPVVYKSSDVDELPFAVVASITNEENAVLSLGKDIVRVQLLDKPAAD